MKNMLQTPAWPAPLTEHFFSWGNAPVF